MRSPLKSGLRGYCRLLAGLDEGLAHRGGPLDVGDRHRPAGAAPLVGAVDAVLHPLEVRQHVLVAPALRAEPLPVVVVARRAAQEHQAVDRARPAQHLAARPDDAAAVQPRLRLGLVAPVDFRVGHELAETPGNMDPGIAVAPAGLDDAQRNPGFSVSRAATTQPADPAPATTTSNSASNPDFAMMVLLRGFARGMPRNLPAIMVSPYRICPQPPPSTWGVGSDRPP